MKVIKKHGKNNLIYQMRVFDKGSILLSSFSMARVILLRPLNQVLSQHKINQRMKYYFSPIKKRERIFPLYYHLINS